MQPSTTNANNCLDSVVWLETRSQREYGDHTPKFTDNSLREKVCVFCNQRKPSSLEELAFSAILEHAELIKAADSTLHHLPHRICWLIGRLLNANSISLAWRLVPLVAEYAETRTNWFEVDPSMDTCLVRFRFAVEVHRKLKSYCLCPSDAISEVLQYHDNVLSTYEDFWTQMNKAFSKIEAETASGCLEPLKTVKPATDGSNVILVSLELTEKRMDPSEFESMKSLQKLNRTLAVPIVFKPTEITLDGLEPRRIPSLLEHLDTQVLSSVDLSMKTWPVADLDALGDALSTCRNLTEIFLQQRKLTDSGEIENVAPSVSRLLSHHRKLQKIGIHGLKLAGTLASCSLPPVVDLQLHQCTFTDEDWDYMASRSDLALDTLIVSSYFYFIHLPSLRNFVLTQAPTLDYLGLDFPTLTVEEICNILRTIAKFNQLSIFDLHCMEELEVSGLEKIAIDIMAIQCARKLFINFRSYDDEIIIDRRAVVSRLNETIRRLSKENRRPPVQLIMETQS